MTDRDLGPAWLAQDLPQPIAAAWQAALQTVDSPEGPSPQRFIAAVEAALRYLTGIQLAALRAAEAPLPELVRGGAFRNPTLGFWFLLAKALRDGPPNLLTAELDAWPDPYTDGTLAELINLRGRLRDGLPAAEHRTLTARLIPLAVEIMRTLAPLRNPRLLMVVAQRPLDAFRHEGAIQVFHGPGLAPPAERARWRGQLVNFALVLAPDPSLLKQNPQARREAIHLAPFVTFERLRDAQAEVVCLWRGMNDRGQVLLADDPEDPRAWRPLGAGTLLWPFQRDDAAPTGREPAFPATLRHLDGGPAPLDPPTARGAPLARPLEPFLPSAGRGASPWSDVSSGHEPARPRRPLGVLAVVVGVGLAIAATAWFALRIASDLERPAAAPVASPQPATAQPPPAPATPPAPTAPQLEAGIWQLTARTLVPPPPAPSGAAQPRPGRRPSGPPTTMSYRLHLQRMSDAEALEGTLTRLPAATSEVRSTLRRPAGTTPASGPVTPVGPSARGSWSLRAGLKGGGPNELVEVGLRVRRVGDGLLGIWRHEGAERTRGAHAGILTGSLEGGAAPEPSPCVVDCLAACADLAPAADPSAEACLDACLAPGRCPTP